MYLDSKANVAKLGFIYPELRNRKGASKRRNEDTGY